MDTEITPQKILYINHNVNSNSDRQKINDKFQDVDWATIDTPKSINEDDYRNYLLTIKNHKFMICPSGNAIGCECHRDWEVLYMNRVPIVEKNGYVEHIFKDFPVLIIDKFDDITEELLIKNEHLFHAALKLDKNKLDMDILFNESVSQSKQLIKNL